MKNILYSIKYGYAYLICKIMDAILVGVSMLSSIIAKKVIKLSVKYGVKTSIAEALMLLGCDQEIYSAAVNEVITEETAEKIIEMYDED